MVNWIDECDLLAKIRPENQKRETRQDRNKARALGHEEIKSQKGKPCCRDGSVICVHWEALVHDGLSQP